MSAVGCANVATTGRARRRWLGALLTGVSGLALGARSAPAAAIERGQDVEIPPLALVDGPLLTSADWSDNAAVFTWFTLDCPYCRRHNARLEQLHQRHGALPMRVIGLVEAADADAVRAYRQHQALHFGLALAPATWRARFMTRAIVPLTAVLDRQHRLRELIPGEMSEDDVLGLMRWAR